MVRLVFRPYTQVGRPICTSGPLRASTRVSSGFALPRHSSPSFGYHRVRSGSTSPTERERRAGGAPPVAPWGGDPTSAGARRPSPSLRRGVSFEPFDSRTPKPEPVAAHHRRRKCARRRPKPSPGGGRPRPEPPEGGTGEESSRDPGEDDNYRRFFSTFPYGTCSLSVSCRYLALDGVYHPLWAAFTSNPTPRRTAPRLGEGRYRPHTIYGLSLYQKDSDPRPAPGETDFCTPHFPAPVKDGGFGAGLFPLRSPLLGESLLVSFPPLSNMLKFSGLSRLI
ncbi:hypothetical protein NFI96_033218 [Prochilodus magdalenae]|nr:hypothetical protein NFI96_032386 [Prochilodus magdalenae]KAI4899656.1 hypothetical protein NFI96_033218 [Prochilodus magdalenae]